MKQEKTQQPTTQTKKSDNIVYLGVSDICKYIAQVYHSWINEKLGLFQIQNILKANITTERFQMLQENFLHQTQQWYSISFKPTMKLYHLIGWGVHIEPTYDIMMKATDVANADISNVARGIVFEQFREYTPSFVQEDALAKYHNYLATYLMSKIYISSDVVNKRFHLIISK